MKNYLVKSLYKVKDTQWHFRDRAEEDNLFDLYSRAHNLSLSSYKKFLQGDYEVRYFTGEVENINQAFYLTFWHIHDLWHNEPCNILYTDPDTFAIKTVDPWHYDKFMMFNHTQPKSLEIDSIVLFEDFFNAGVRYFPSTMESYIWGIGRNQAVKWNFKTYHTEQIILNDMLWSQKVKVDDILDVSMNYAMFINMDQYVSEAFNNGPVDLARILHFHSSRDIAQTVNIMEDLAGQFRLI